jgi:ribose-phosphate pyrophosphokinase
MTHELKVFGGTANPELTAEICRHLGCRLGQSETRRFADGEIYFQILENVRGADIFVVQPTCPPVNDNLIELTLMMDATMDLHAAQIQGFFNIPVDHLFATPVLVDFFKKADLPKLTVVSPDAGGVERARGFAKRLNGELAIIDKRRTSANVAEVMNVVGDVAGRSALIVDDIVDTAGTLVNTVEALRDAGARDVYACCTHGVLSGPAVDRIRRSSLDELVVTNTIPLSPAADQCGKIRRLSVGKLLARAIESIHDETSVSVLFI